MANLCFSVNCFMACNGYEVWKNLYDKSYNRVLLVIDKKYCWHDSAPCRLLTVEVFLFLDCNGLFYYI